MSFTNPPNRWMSPPPLYDNRLPAHSTGTTLNPYLELPHLLSLTWLAYPILSLIFIVFRLSISSDSAQTAVTNAKGNLLTACHAAQEAASSTASMPRYMAVATNEQIADAVNGTMNAARASLVLALTIMETIINFIVDIYRSTFLCFLELIVRGALSILIGATQEISNLITNTFNSLRTSIQNDISSANSVISSAVNAINKVNPFGNISAPQISVPSLDSLQNVTLPTDFQDALLKTELVDPFGVRLEEHSSHVCRLDTPFELLKKDINDTFIGINFNSSVLPVPERSTLSFCDNMDTSVVDNLGRDLLKIAKVGIIILAALALLLLVGNCALEWYKWQCLKRHLEYTRQAWMTDPTILHANPATTQPTVELSDHNLLMLQANSSHPFLTRVANQLTALLHLSPSQHIHVQWFFHYIFHPPALIQLFAIAPLEAKYQAQANTAVSDFSGTIFTSLNESMYNQSSLYANDINGRVDTVQSTINNGLFGWVNGTTTTLNDTLNAFYSDIQNAVSTVFNGTILEQPAQEFIQCFIGSKVDALEEALTFLHNNLVVNMPRVNESALVLSPDQINEASQPIAEAAIGGGDNGSEGLVGRLVNTYVKSLKKERIMFAVFLGLWGLVVIMALCIIFWHSYGKAWMEARGRRKWRRQQRSGFDNIVIPFKTSDVKGEKQNSDTGGPHVNLPSFTPMASPGVSGILNGTGRPPAEQDNHHPLPKKSLTMLGPKFEKSFDSFFDHASRRADSEQQAAVSSSSTREHKFPWFKRFLHKPALPSQKVADSRRSSRRGHRPQLTISTERAGSLREIDLPIIETTSPSDDSHMVPPSAWSLSPGSVPAPKPWLHNTIRPTAPPVHPLHSKPRPNVPVDVGGSSDDLSSSILEAEPQTHLTVPLHHGRGHARHPLAQVPRLPSPPPPPEKMLRAANVSMPAVPPPMRTLVAPPGLAPSKTQRTVTDPFVTPFDDEARVSSPDTGMAGVGAGHHSYENPFTFVAI
ncbi:hypothetical protein EW146_g7040 [Bondarzewia mesenterica]|uniref:Plasma membrane fusion protein PRM1 n=1 Tax=Bondarzewia mesenterica TaxID=1095465 RepID=A0A4S4LMM8_9AGAM|nr:hypothetical protein EW146_g7040 [Bondarzewia mesenterica]